MINDRVYHIDLKKFIKQLLVPILRQPKIIAFLNALIAPIKSIYNDFTAYKDAVIYDTKHDGSVGLLEKVLNDFFDASERRIYITNVDVIDTEHYYDPAQGEPIYFYDSASGSPAYFLDPEIFYQNGTDFTVHLPNDILPPTQDEQEIQETQIRTKVEKFKFDGLKYELLWLNL